MRWRRRRAGADRTTSIWRRRWWFRRPFALKPIPDRIGQEMPWVKPYYYVKTGERIAIVNPLGRYVVSVIE